MKANELMIGDWIRIDEPDKYAGATGQIQSLMYHREGDAAYFHVFIQDRLGHVLRDVCSDDIRPIPLTPEILEKNGFHEKWDRDIKLMACDTITIEIGDNYKFYKDGKMYLRRVLAPLYYVHQLQHAFRICGIEKEIEL